MRHTDRRWAKFAAVVTAMRASFVGAPEDDIIAETRTAVIEVRAKMRRARTGRPHRRNGGPGQDSSNKAHKLA